MNPYKHMNESQLEKLYNKLRQIDEYKKQKKMVDSRQVLLDDAIKAAERKQAGSQICMK